MKILGIHVDFQANPRALKSAGGVLVSGQKLCGKTTTCMRFQKSFQKLNTTKAIELAKLDTKHILEGEKPRLINEWQTVPDNRDNAGLECDAIIHLQNGKWCAIKIKLGGDTQIERGARSLQLLRKKIIEKGNNIPASSFLLILTAAGPAYRREDGIYVVPIDMLMA